MKIVTGNRAKYKLFNEELKTLGIEVKEIDIKIPEIQHNDFDKVVEAKAKYVYDYYGSPHLVDDSGLFLEAYPNFPGVSTKFALKNLGKEGFMSLLNGKSKGAIFKCKIGCWVHDRLFVVEGSVEGVLDLAREPKEGDPGPLSAWFVPNNPTDYGALEHRYRAIWKLKGLLEEIKEYKE